MVLSKVAREVACILVCQAGRGFVNRTAAGPELKCPLHSQPVEPTLRRLARHAQEKPFQRPYRHTATLGQDGHRIAGLVSEFLPALRQIPGGTAHTKFDNRNRPAWRLGRNWGCATRTLPAAVMSSCVIHAGSSGYFWVRSPGAFSSNEPRSRASFSCHVEPSGTTTSLASKTPGTSGLGPTEFLVVSVISTLSS